SDRATVREYVPSWPLSFIFGFGKFADYLGFFYFFGFGSFADYLGYFFGIGKFGDYLGHFFGVGMFADYLGYFFGFVSGLGDAVARTLDLVVLRVSAILGGSLVYLCVRGCHTHFLKCFERRRVRRRVQCC